eukprot:scaffold23209_cov25-Tisochrysis_lutea.AAC.3
MGLSTFPYEKIRPTSNESRAGYQRCALLALADSDSGLASHHAAVRDAVDAAKFSWDSGTDKLGAHTYRNGSIGGATSGWHGCFSNASTIGGGVCMAGGWG